LKKIKQSNREWKPTVQTPTESPYEARTTGHPRTVRRLRKT
jgi:hypothetical protein